jgi:hypothetical protein
VHNSPNYALNSSFALKYQTRLKRLFVAERSSLFVFSMSDEEGKAFEGWYQFFGVCKFDALNRGGVAGKTLEKKEMRSIRIDQLRFFF